MALRRLSTLWFVFCIGCGGEVIFIDCEEIVLTTADGEVDACDLQACEAAFGDGCTAPCMVLQSLPQQYVDDDGVAWDAFDFCPDWGVDTGGDG